MTIYTYNPDSKEFEGGPNEPWQEEQDAMNNFLIAVQNGHYQVLEPGTKEREYFGGYTDRERVVILEVERRVSLEGIPIEVPGEKRSRRGGPDDFTTTSRLYWDNLDKRDNAMFQLDSFNWIAFPATMFDNPQRDNLAAQWRANIERKERMRRAAALDPEGAFGGRGNNVAI